MVACTLTGNISGEATNPLGNILREAMRQRVGNLYRFWECVARRMVIYEFYFLDPRLISIQFEAPSKRKRRRSAND
jgi:hypothetical protein